MRPSTILAACLIGMLLLTTHAYAWTNTTGGSGPQAIGDGAPAQAQSAHARSSSRSTAAAASRSRASASATGGAGGSVVVNNTTAGDPAGDPAGGAAGGRGGHYPAASAYAPSFAGASPCTGQAMSGGGQGLIGVTLGLQQMDPYCQVERLGNLQTAAEQIDFAWQCLRRGGEFRQAAADAGYPCPSERSKVVQPVVQRQPAPVATDRQEPSDFCFTASPGERRQHRECQGVKYE